MFLCWLAELSSGIGENEQNERSPYIIVLQVLNQSFKENHNGGINIWFALKLNIL